MSASDAGFLFQESEGTELIDQRSIGLYPSNRRKEHSLYFVYKSYWLKIHDI